MRYQLDVAGRFVCDMPAGGFADNWTDDAVPQPIGAPRYIGASFNESSGEWFGGHWIDTASRSPAGLLSANNVEYERATRSITADYPKLEKDTWPTQDKESKAWVADPVNALTPWIDRAAATRGLSREEYLRRTLAKARQFELVSSYLTGTRQKYEDQIKAGGDPVLDYAIPPSLLAEMQAKALLIMTSPTVDLKEHL